MDVIFYFVISLLVATIFCYIIFYAKNSFLKEDIKTQEQFLKTVGTDQQKEHEKEVVLYQEKIADFSNLLEKHKFASNVFAFVEDQTMPSVWFKQFSLDEKSNGVQLSGEAEDMDAFSRQVVIFENNKYVKDMGTLNSSIVGSARAGFNISLVLNQDIFSYFNSLPEVVETETPAGPPVVAPEGGSVTPENPSATEEQPTGEIASSEKRIISFKLILNPEVVGVIDETNHIITLDVSYGTDVKNLTSSIVSPGATVLPASNTPQDFTNPVVYTVTAQDSSTQEYEARVIVASPPEPAKKSGVIIWAIIILAVVCAVGVVVILLIRKKNQKVNE